MLFAYVLMRCAFLGAAFGLWAPDLSNATRLILLGTFIAAGAIANTIRCPRCRTPVVFIRLEVVWAPGQPPSRHCIK